MAISITSQKRFWDTFCLRRCPDHPVIEVFVGPKVDFIKGLDIGSVLDVGCGNGYFTRPLSKLGKCVALDFSQRMLDSNPVDVKKVCSDACDMPFPDNSFDLVFCSNLLHHIPSPERAVSEMARVSSKYVVFSEPNRNNPLMFLYGLLKSVERGTLRFSRKYMIDLACRAGLRVVGAKTMGIILPNKTPECLLWLFKLLDGSYPLAFFNIIICKK